MSVEGITEMGQHGAEVKVQKNRDREEERGSGEGIGKKGRRQEFSNDGGQVMEQQLQE